MFQRAEDEPQHEHHGADDAGGPEPTDVLPVSAVHHRKADVIHQGETEGDGEDAGVLLLLSPLQVRL